MICDKREPELCRQLGIFSFQPICCPFVIRERLGLRGEERVLSLDFHFNFRWAERIPGDILVLMCIVLLFARNSPHQNLASSAPQDIPEYYHYPFPKHTQVLT